MECECGQNFCGVAAIDHDAPKAGNSTTTSSPDPGLKKRILIAEDDKILLEVLSEWLCVVGYQVVAAQNGSEALRLFSSSVFDLVLTDWKMPEMDGWQLASQIKQRSPDTPVMLMTGQAPAEVTSMMDAGCVDFLIFKPFRFEEIHKTMQVLLAQMASADK
jgi:CheY-like chemotaxis protein